MLHATSTYRQLLIWSHSLQSNSHELRVNQVKTCDIALIKGVLLKSSVIGQYSGMRERDSWGQGLAFGKGFYVMPSDITRTLWLRDVKFNLLEFTWLISCSIVNDHYSTC